MRIFFYVFFIGSFLFSKDLFSQEIVSYKILTCQINSFDTRFNNQFDTSVMPRGVGWKQLQKGDSALGTICIDLKSETLSFTKPVFFFRKYRIDNLNKSEIEGNYFVILFECDVQIKETLTAHFVVFRNRQSLSLNNTFALLITKDFTYRFHVKEQ